MADLFLSHLCLFIVILFSVGSESTKCGYSSCHAIKEGYTNVHMIAHTHDDVGWLKTMDQYYWGNEYDTAQAGVQYIIDSVVKSLKYDPNKRFIYVETAFFWEWWKKQTKEVHRLVRRLVREGRLEFIGGAWSMHDEAATHYQSIIDEFTWGFRRLNDEFGDCGTPRVGWQIDPFGHARETASIMARLGFDALFVGRVDYRDKAQRELTKSMEMIWESSPNLGNETDLFFGVLYNTYEAPNSFCFDLFCGWPPVVDDVNSPEYNADSMAETFISEIMNRTEVYKGSNIAMAMGGDFNYQPANVYFTSTDRLIKAVNARQATHGSMINLLYSTPSCYAKALNDEGLEWPTKQDDFFPYASTPDSYWSGYYSSRPAIKRYERMGNNFLQVCKQLSALSDLEPKDETSTSLDSLREAMGVMQHHDAIAGTEKQAVAFDYARKLSIGFDKCSNLTDTALNKLMAVSSSSDALVIESCNLLNISQCQVSESESSFVVTLYNPLSRTVSRYIRLPVSGDGTSYTVYDSDGETVTVQVVAIPDAVTNIPGRTSEATVELVFQASDLPPLGFRSYYVTSTGSTNNHKAAAAAEDYDKKSTAITIGFSDSLQLTIDKTSGLPTTLTIPGVSESASFQQNFFYYSSYAGNNEIYQNQSSGAYIFRPNSSLITISSQATVKTYKGDLVEEVHQVFSSWVTQVIRAYKGEDHLEFNWLIGPVPISDGIGKEVVTKYVLDGMVTNSTFYTDSNGREMIERVLNYRPTYNLTPEEPIAANYFPVNTRIMMKDTVKQVAVVTDRSHGCSSLEDGEMELMLHRRLLYDDDMGVLEALNEEAFGKGLVVRGTHYMSAGSANNQSAVDRRLVQRRVLDAWTFFTPTSLTLAEWQSAYTMKYTALKGDLPQNVQILTLEPWKGSHFLLRLEHILEKNDDSEASTSVTVNLNDIFEPFTIISVSEKTLGANRGLEEVTRLVWKKENNQETPSKTAPQDLPYVVLTPMAIKTFVIKVVF